MKRILLLPFVFLLALASQAEDEAQKQKLADLEMWHFLFEETRIQELQQRLSQKFRPQNFAIVDVNLISVNDGLVHANQTVLVEDGKIRAAGKTGAMNVPDGWLKIDGNGRYVVPGLTDMHVHNLVSSSQHLLNLANGVTTVRDMDGFSWLLEQRKQIQQNRLLAPNMYVAGHILNARPLGMYATVVKSPDHGRELVRRQKKDGYDFIKIHNNMPLDLYEAILKEAGKLKIDVVGHVPHELQVHQAVKLGQRTMEHFKGYILDAGLVLTKENYVDATRGAEIWNCPTFYTYREHLRGPAAHKVLKDGEMDYVSWRDREDWKQLADQKGEKNLAAQQNILPMSRKIFRDLLPIGAQFIAGTDSGGGYPFMVPGFALHEELRIMTENGLSPSETLKTATINAATAMRRDRELRTIEPGKRADLLLLRANPLSKIHNLRMIDGIAVRGVWLSRADLDGILTAIREIYNPATAFRKFEEPSQSSIDSLLKDQAALRAKGFVFRAHDIEAQSELLRKRKQQ